MVIKKLLALLPINCIFELFENDAHNIVSRRGWEKLNDMENKSPYCPVCSGCGEEGCCSPLGCKQSPDGKYCEWYLRDLKFGYLMYDSIYDLIPTDEETKKKLDEIWEKNYNLIYKIKTDGTN